MYSLELEAAKKVAYEAGALLKEWAQKEFKVEFKGAVDLVTPVDLESQKLIISQLSKQFPNYAVLAEESDGKKPETDYIWVIDPLDGTTNYAHGFPIFAVSIGLVYKDEPVVGVVYEPNLNELFTAVKSSGAYLNDKPIKVSKVAKLDQSLLSTGFPYNLRQRPKEVLIPFGNFTLRAQGVRRAGAAAIDVCYVACGRFDGFWELGLRPWDTAAASLILAEAGGQMSKYDNSPFNIWTPEMLATNGLIHQQMLEVLALPID